MTIQKGNVTFYWFKFSFPNRFIDLLSYIVRNKMFDCINIWLNASKLVNSKIVFDAE
jgi:hypothetical protein